MWETSRLLTEWAGVCQTTTGNPTYLTALGITRPKQRHESRARYCGIARIDVIEQLIDWETPEVTGKEKDLRCESAVQSIKAHLQEAGYAA